MPLASSPSSSSCYNQTFPPPPPTPGTMTQPCAGINSVITSSHIASLPPHCHVLAASAFKLRTESFAPILANSLHTRWSCKKEKKSYSTTAKSNVNSPRLYKAACFLLLQARIETSITARFSSVYASVCVLNAWPLGSFVYGNIQSNGSNILTTIWVPKHKRCITW